MGTHCIAKQLKRYPVIPKGEIKYAILYLLKHFIINFVPAQGDVSRFRMER